MKVAVLGTDGMLGHKMFQTLYTQGFDVLGFSRNDPDTGVQMWKKMFPSECFHNGLNLLDSKGLTVEFTQLRDELQKHQHNYIINCIGVIKQVEDGKQAFPCVLLNSLLPHLLSEWAREWHGRVVHISTDCVFNGHRGNYTENDLSDADDLYGKSKYLGEIAYENALTLRTSIIGRELKTYSSLLEWFLGNNHGAVSGYDRHIYTGVTTNFLASLIGRIIREKPDLHGLFHVASAPITKYELLKKVKKYFDLDIQLTCVDGTILDRSLNGGKFVTETGFQISSWDQMIVEMKADPTPYDEWRWQKLQNTLD